MGQVSKVEASTRSSVRVRGLGNILCGTQLQQSGAGLCTGLSSLSCSPLLQLPSLTILRYSLPFSHIPICFALLLLLM